MCDVSKNNKLGLFKRSSFFLQLFDIALLDVFVRIHHKVFFCDYKLQNLILMKSSVFKVFKMVLK